MQLEAYLLQNSAALVTVLPVIDDFLRTVDFHLHALGALYLLYVLNAIIILYYFIIFCLIGVVFFVPFAFRYAQLEAHKTGFPLSAEYFDNAVKLLGAHATIADQSQDCYKRRT